MICVLEDLDEERDEAAPEAAPGAKGEMDMHRMISALPFLLAPALFCLPFHCVNPLLPKSING